MTVYVLVWEERHRGNVIEVFEKDADAIARAEEIKESYRQGGCDPTDEKCYENQIRNVRLTCESERVSVEKHEVK